MRSADLLIHDAQYTDEEYPSHTGWDHSSIGQLADLATLAGVRRLVPLPHDPSHRDDELDIMLAEITERAPSVEVVPGAEGARYELHHTG